MSFLLEMLRKVVFFFFGSFLFSHSNFWLPTQYILSFYAVIFSVLYSPHEQYELILNRGGN